MSERERRVVRRWYRRALRLFPARIRRRHAPEMEEMFVDAWMDARARGPWDTGALLVRTARDLALNGLGARYDGGVGMGDLGTDVRHAARGLLKRPGFTAVALLTLTLGIGGNTAVYSILDAAYFDPLPYPDDDELVVPYNSYDRTQGLGFAAFSAPFHFAIRESGAFAGVASLGPSGANIGGTDRPERVSSARVSGDFFDVVGVPPALGRGFTPDDDRPGAAPVAVISQGLWTRRFANDPDVVARPMLIDDVPTTVLGVMPAGFRLFMQGVDLWTPYRTDPASFDATNAVNNNRILIARLHEGSTPEAAAARLGEAVQRMGERFPDAVTETHGVTPVPLRRHLYGEARGSLLVLFGAVGLVLLIACANLGNLLTVRAEERRTEMAVRSALGAGRARLLRGLLAESMLLSLGGAALGALAATLLIDVVRPLAPVSVPLPASGVLDGSVLAFTLGIAVGAGLLFGMVPASLAAGRDLRGVLVEGGRGGGATRARARGALVAGEVALTAVLLVGSGLMLNSMWRLQRADAGFETADRTAFQVRLPAGRYGSDAEASAFYRRLLEEVRAVPGVQAAGLGQFLPLAGASNWGFEVQGREDLGLGFADYTLVSPGYLESVGMRVVEGRELTWADAGPGAEPVVLVSETMADRLWPEGSALGQLVNVDLGPRVWRRVVGIVSDVRNRSLAEEPSDLLYFPPVGLPMSNPRFMSLVVHHADTGAPVEEVRTVVRGLDAGIPLTAIQSLSSIAQGSEGRRRFMLTLLGLFAALAVLLAAVGLYGVVSYTWSLRTREIGLRMAVGAGRASVMRMVLGQSAALVVSGLVAGLAGAAALARFLEGLLYDVPAVDPLTYAAVALLLAAVAAVATWVPAARASGADPTTVLRS